MELESQGAPQVELVPARRAQSFGFQKVDLITRDLRGFYLIDHGAYHAGLGISSSVVKRALKSHEVFLEPERETQAMRFGAAFHMALLEPELYYVSYGVLPKIPGHPNSHAYKAARAAWEAQNGARVVISQAEAALIDKMRSAVLKHPDAKPKGTAELMACLECEYTGHFLKCKMDLFAGDRIIDYKTTKGGVSPSDFTRELVRYGYHISAAYYLDIVAELTGGMPAFDIVVVSKPRAEVECYRLDDEVIDHGRKLYKHGLARLTRWLTKGPENKAIRPLQMSSRIAYSTKYVLEYIGAS